MEMREALEHQFELVTMLDVERGACYIGTLERVERSLIKGKWSGACKILGVFKYPSQKAILYNNTYCQRKPYQYGTIQNFMLEDIEIYSTNLSASKLDEAFYNISVKESIENALETADMAERVILDCHLRALSPTFIMSN